MAKKSGKERRAKRKVKKAVEAQLPEHWKPANDKEERENARLVQQSLRWATNEQEIDFSQKQPNEHSLKSIALLVTRRGLLSSNPKVRQMAVSAVLQMERQNQEDEKMRLRKEEMERKEQHNHLHVNITQNDLLETMTQDQLIEFKKLIDAQDNKR